MCSASIGSGIARGMTAVATFGTSEIARKVPGPIGNVAKLPETGGGLVGNILNPPKPPSGPAAPTPSSGTTDQGPLPTNQDPAPMTEAAQAKQRRLAALRQGIVSTVATSGRGAASTPSLSSPSAYAAGIKTMLGS